MRASIILVLPALLFSGCTDGPGEVEDEAWPYGPWSDQLFAVAHPGGTLRLTALEPVEVDVYGPDGLRITRLALPEAPAIDVPPGEVVLRVLGAAAVTAHAGFDLGNPLASRPLLADIERLVLRQPSDGLPEDAALVGVVEFGRTPLELAVLTSGTYNLNMTVRSAHGPVLQAERGGLALGPIDGLRRTTGAIHENLRGTTYEVEMRGESNGAIIIEAITWSLADVAARIPVLAAALEDVSVVYGELGPHPVGLELPAGSPLVVWGNGTIALWGPDGTRLATAWVDDVRAFDGTPRHISAVALEGSLLLGATRVPQDFELHPLEVDEVMLQPRMGARNTYMVHEARPIIHGAVYGVGPAPFHTPCFDDSVVRILDDAGEARWTGGHGTQWLDGSPTVRIEGLASLGCIESPIVLRTFMPAQTAMRGGHLAAMWSTS